MAAKYIGAHVPTKGGLGAAVRLAHSIGCTAVQVFTSSPQMWKSAPVKPEATEAFRTALRETNMGPCISHDSYLVNLASPNDELREKSILALREEIERCSLYGIPWVVSHIGAHMGQGEEEGIKRAADGLLRVLAETPDLVGVLAETTAGQGSALNSKLECMERFLDASGRSDRLGVCLDTCHLFSAGYDLRTPEAYEQFTAELDARIGLGNVKAIHCNDSKHELGSCKDRHEHIGKGTLGLEPFRLLLNDPRFESTPFLIETPEAETHHAENVRVLWSLCEK